MVELLKCEMILHVSLEHTNGLMTALDVYAQSKNYELRDEEQFYHKLNFVDVLMGTL